MPAPKSGASDAEAVHVCAGSQNHRNLRAAGVQRLRTIAAMRCAGREVKAACLSVQGVEGVEVLPDDPNTR